MRKSNRCHCPQSQRLPPPWASLIREKIAGSQRIVYRLSRNHQTTGYVFSSCSTNNQRINVCPGYRRHELKCWMVYIFPGTPPNRELSENLVAMIRIAVPSVSLAPFCNIDRELSMLTPEEPMHAAGLPSADHGPVAELTEADLQWIVDAARPRLAQATSKDDLNDLLESVTFDIPDLPRTLLGQTLGTTTATRA